MTINNTINTKKTAENARITGIKRESKQSKNELSESVK
jgi:hypothetical protein